MINPLKIIFNQFYIWACKYNFANSPQLSAMYILGLILFSNLFTLVSLLGLSLGFSIFQYVSGHIMIVVLLGLSITTMPIYLMFVKGKTYFIFFKEYEFQSLRRKRKFKYLTIGYIIFSIISFLGCALLSGLYDRGYL